VAKTASAEAREATARRGSFIRRGAERRRWGGVARTESSQPKDANDVKVVTLLVGKKEG
jgi:hypothetical protein